MTEPVLNVLTYAKDLEDAGFNRIQAEAIARGNFTLVEQRFDNVLTREHFDSTMGMVDAKSGETERHVRGIEARLDRMETRLDALDPIKTQVNLLTWMMGLVILVLVVPQLQSWFGVG